MNILLGRRGRLGTAIAGAPECGPVVALERSVYAGWSGEGADDDVVRYFESIGSETGTVYVAAGLTDPRRPQTEHDAVNFMLARNVVVGASRAGFRVVTFGTVMEAIASDQPPNAYVASKIRLGRFVADFEGAMRPPLHLQIHTLFGGGPPAPFMFLGQMLEALNRNTAFDMSAGNQLREYHHVDDEARAIAQLLASGAEGVVPINHGLAFRLSDLATHVFKAFNCLDKLNIGAIAGSRYDNFGVISQRTPGLEDFAFRDAFPAVVEYLKTWRT